MNKIPLNARVECSDGACGELTTIIVNLTARRVTHLVVADKSFPRSIERLVPIERLVETSSRSIRVDCSEDGLTEMEPFAGMQYIQIDGPEAEPVEQSDSQPEAMSVEAVYMPVEVERIAPGEMAVRRGTRLEATDGPIGVVGELGIDPDTSSITHLVLLEGHLWGKKEIALPLSAIDHVDEEAVYLKLDKEAVEGLPAIPVHRHSGDPGAEVELVARIFEDPEGAAETLEFVKGLQQRKVLKILNSAILVKDEDGEVILKEKGDLDATQGRLFGAITGGLVGLVGGPVGAVVGALTGAGAGGLAAKWIDMGFSNSFLDGLQERLQPGSSALVLLVEDKWVEKLSVSLADREGMYFRQSLTDALVEQLVQEDEPGEVRAD